MRMSDYEKTNMHEFVEETSTIFMYTVSAREVEDKHLRICRGDHNYRRVDCTSTEALHHRINLIWDIISI